MTSAALNSRQSASTTQSSSHLVSRVRQQEALEWVSLSAKPKAATPEKPDLGPLQTSEPWGVGWGACLLFPRVQETVRLRLCPSQTDCRQRAGLLHTCPEAWTPAARGRILGSCLCHLTLASQGSLCASVSPTANPVGSLADLEGHMAERGGGKGGSHCRQCRVQTTRAEPGSLSDSALKDAQKQGAENC